MTKPPMQINPQVITPPRTPLQGADYQITYALREVVQAVNRQNMILQNILNVMQSNAARGR